MKDIRERIIEILDEEIAKKKSRTTEDEIIVAADKILALPLYLKEFIEWSIFPDRDITAFYRNTRLLFRDKDDIEYTLDELYQYWKTEVNK